MSDKLVHDEVDQCRQGMLAVDVAIALPLCWANVAGIVNACAMRADPML